MNEGATAVRISWQAHVVHGVVAVLFRLAPKDEEKQRRKLQARGRTGGSAPKRLKGITVTTSERHGMQVIRLAPEGGRPARTVFYCHGGAYVNGAVGLHWAFLRKLALETQAELVVPLYPLGPVDTAATTVPAVAAILAEEKATVVMGDSAGGGLALAVTQVVRDDGGSLPQHMVLIAPWLDVRNADPRQRAMERGDIMLGVDGLRAAGRLYAGDLALDDPLVSPLLGELRGLPPITVLVGTKDLLSVDARELVRRCQEADQAIELVEAPGMQHVYPILPFLPEARQARMQIAEIVRSTPAG